MAASILVLAAFASACSGTPQVTQSARPEPPAPTAARSGPTEAPTADPGRSPADAADEDGETTPAEAVVLPTPTAEPVDDVLDSVPELVAFVEEVRGEEFDQIPEIVYTDPEEIIASYATGVPVYETLPPDHQRIIDRIDDVYRAVGVSGQDLNVLDARVAASAIVGAYYDWDDDVVVFPSENGQAVTEIPLVDRPLMVHELTHALQAPERLPWSFTLEDPFVATAMLEGEAEWMFDRYLQRLDDATYHDWFDEQAALYDPTVVAAVEPVLAAMFFAPYLLGSRFFHVRFATDGLEGVDEVFESHRVVARMLLDPWAYDGRETYAETFDFYPPMQTGSGEWLEIASDVPMSAVDWYLAFSTAMPGPEALSAARAITSFTLPAGWIALGDQTCFAITVTALDAERGRVEDALRTWADVEGVRRWVRPNDDTFDVGGCDPGPGNVPEPLADPLTAVERAAVVIDAELWAHGLGLDPSVGFCVGWSFVDVIEDERVIDPFAWYDDLDLEALPATC